MAGTTKAIKQPRGRRRAGFLLFCVALLEGCQNGPMSGRMQQYQLENDRLLSEFRAQKKENEQLRADRARLLQQQAETEKLAAKLQSQLNGNRSLAQNPSSRSELGSGTSKGLSDRKSSAESQLSSGKASGLNGSASPSSSPRSAANSDTFQWRPIRKATR